MQRRELLATVQSAVLIFSGCVSNSSDTDKREDQKKEIDIRLSDVYLSNTHSKKHTVEVEVIFNGDIVQEEVVQLEAASENRTKSRTIENDWPDTAGVFVVRARVDDSDWKRQNLAKRYGDGTNCVRSMVKVMPDESFGIWANETCPN
jgi:hypothetical protein